MTRSFNRETSVRKSSTSLEGGGGAIAATEGGAASRTLSARVASSLRLFASAEASTIRTRRSSRGRVPLVVAALSPSNRCILRRGPKIAQFHGMKQSL